MLMDADAELEAQAAEATMLRGGGGGGMSAQHSGISPAQSAYATPGSMRSPGEERLRHAGVNPALAQKEHRTCANCACMHVQHDHVCCCEQSLSC